MRFKVKKLDKNYYGPNVKDCGNVIKGLDKLTGSVVIEQKG